MKAASVTHIKKELNELDKKRVVELCLKLAAFKKENKEFLTYLLFESDYEDGYILSIQNEMDEAFQNINRSNYYLMKKSVRKILKNTKKYVRYSKKTETEVELLIHFCKRMKELEPSIKFNTVLSNTFYRQLAISKNKILSLHEDLQYDYSQEIESLKL